MSGILMQKQNGVEKQSFLSHIFTEPRYGHHRTQFFRLYTKHLTPFRLGKREDRPRTYCLSREFGNFQRWSLSDEQSKSKISIHTRSKPHDKFPALNRAIQIL